MAATSPVGAEASPERRRRRSLEPAFLAAVGSGLVALAVFVYFFRLGVPSWRGDELIYREAGAQLWSGNFGGNVENTPLAQYTLGAAKEVFGSGPIAVRAPTALAGLLTGLFLALLARRLRGWWAAALAFALWCLLPRPAVIGAVDVEQIKIERFARLDVYMGLFVAGSLFAGWRWAETARWRWAAAAGAAIGLAAASKAPGVLVLPAVVAGGLVTIGVSRRSLTQATAIAVAAFLVLLAVYLPAGSDAPSLLGQMRDAQSHHAALGHPFVFGDTRYARAPWWGNVWWQWKSLGTPATASVAICLVLAPFLLARGLAVMLVGATLVTFAFLSFGLSYSLPHYYYDWQPPLVLTCALVLFALSGRAIPGRVAAALLAIPLALAAIGTVRDVARLEPRDYSRLNEELGPRLRSGVTATANPFDLAPNLPGARVVTDPAGVPDLAAVVDDATFSSRWRPPAVTSFLRRYRSQLLLRRIDYLRVYLPRSPAVARRLAIASVAAQPDLTRWPVSRRARALAVCLVRAGLQTRIALASRSSASVEVSLSSTSASAIVAVEPSPAAANQRAAATAAFIRANGVRGTAQGPVAYRGRPRPVETRLVESCVARQRRG